MFSAKAWLLVNNRSLVLIASVRKVFIKAGRRLIPKTEGRLDRIVFNKMHISRKMDPALAADLNWYTNNGSYPNLFPLPYPANVHCGGTRRSPGH